MIIEHKKIEYKGKTVFEKIVLSAKFKRLPKLFTENEACFLFLTKGAFQFRTPTNLLTFNEGDAMLSKCGNYFVEEVILNSHVQVENFSAVGAYFYPSVVKSFFESDLSLHSFQNNFDTNKISVEPLLKSYIASLNFILDNSSLADENLIVNKLKELLIILSKSEKASSVSDFINTLFVPFEYNFKEIIQSNLYTNLSLEELAYLCSCSLATFKRKFTSLYNESPARYLLCKKLDKSKDLLLIRSKSISDIAFESGFDSVSNYDKAFKKNVGLTPSEYRLSQKDKSLHL